MKDQTGSTVNSIRRLYYAGSDLIAEYDGSGAMLDRYVHGLSAGDDPLVWFPGSSTAAANMRLLLGDARGSIVAVSNPSWVPLAINAYDEFGVPDSGNAGRFGYTGQTWVPELGLWHYKARMYSPTLGRFMQTDPIGYADGMNMYAYVGNDPMNKVDPTGMCATPEQIERAKQGQAGPIGGTPECPIIIANANVGGRDPCEFVGVSCATGEGIRDLLDSGARFFVPGYEFGADCIVGDGCTLAEGAVKAVEIIPVARLVSKSVKAVRAVRRATRTCGCFEEGTLVATPSGLVAIETIEIGDLVLAQNEATGEIAAKPVVDLIRPEPKPLYRLTLRGEGGDLETFHATDDHPWKVEGEGWVQMINLVEGALIDTASEANMEVLLLETTDRIENTFNLTVADWHTFLVGEHQAVVHNACDPNKLDHIFRADHPGALALANRLGSREAAFNAVETRMQQIVNSQGLTGVVTQQINVSGVSITVRGNVINGSFRVGTFW